MGIPGGPQLRRSIDPIVVLISLLAMALVGLIVVASMLVARHSGQADDPGHGARPNSDHVSTSEQWIGAVCQLGTYQNGKGGILSGADGGSATCNGKSANGKAFGGYIMIGAYSSQFRLQNAVALMLHGSVYATVTDDSGTSWVFYSMSGTADLSPLAQFGFTMHTV